MADPSFEYRIDPDHSLAYAKLYGDVDGPFIASRVRALRADPEWSDAFDVIWDERDVAVLDITLDGLEAMVDAQTDGQTGRDLVVSRRESRADVLRLYAVRTRARGRPAEVCETLRDALGVLGLDALPAPLRLL